MKPKVIAVDIDRTLTAPECTAWNPEDCLTAIPHEVNIALVRKWYKSHFVVLHTARRHNLYESTIKWLAKWDVPYHAVRFEKMGASCYIDDKAYNPDCETCMKRLEDELKLK